MSNDEEVKLTRVKQPEPQARFTVPNFGCLCGCGLAVKSIRTYYASAACRKRMQRRGERVTLQAGTPEPNAGWTENLKPSLGSLAIPVRHDIENIRLETYGREFCPNCRGNILRTGTAMKWQDRCVGCGHLLRCS